MTLRAVCATGLVAIVVSCPARADFRVEVTGPPEGFEDLAQAQTTAVDVYYGGRFLVTTLATYDRANIRFLQPGDIVARLDQLRDPSAVREILGKGLPNHAQLSCTENPSPTCGRLAPDAIGVILDRSNFQVRLFIARDQLLTAKRSAKAYLPASTTPGIGLVQNLAGTLSGTDGGASRYSLFGRTRSGNNDRYAFADWVSTSDQSMSVDEAGYHHGGQDISLRAGLFESDSTLLTGLDRQLLLGARIERTLRRRADLGAVLASPLTVFLPTRSRVDVLRDGRLISSEFLEAGNRQVPTGSLPAGAYNVDLLITGSDGSQRRERRLFIKSSLLAPPDEPLWFAEAGQLRLRAGRDAFPERQDAWQLRSGYRWRANRWLGLGVAAAASRGQGLLELSLQAMSATLLGGGEIYRETGGGWGLGVRGAGRWGRTNLSFSAQNRQPDQEPEAGQSLIITEQRLLSAAVSQRIGQRGLLSIGASESESDAGIRTRQQGARYLHRLVLGQHQDLQISLSGDRIDGDWRISLGLTWTQTRHHWQHIADVSHTDSEIAGDSDGAAGSLQSRWRGPLAGMDVNLGGTAQRQAERQALTLDAQQESHLGRSRASVSHVRDEQARSTQYFANHETSLVVSPSGRLAGGGPGTAPAAALLDLRAAEGASIQVRANGQNLFRSQGGGLVAVPLPAYQSHRVEIVDQGTALLDLDTSPRDIVLYPGEVQELTWEMQRMRVLLARVWWRPPACPPRSPPDCVTEAMGNARIVGLGEQLRTDAAGFFQAEIPVDTKTLEAEWQGRRCHMDLRGQPVENGVMRAPKLICRVTAEAADAPLTASPASESVCHYTGRPGRRRRVCRPR